MLERLRQVAVRVVDSNALQQEVVNIRRHVYCDELGWVTPDQTWDANDEQSAVFLAGNGGRWSSTVRMILPGSDFEMEQYFDLSTFRGEGTCVEVGRLAVLPCERHSLMSLALFRALYRFAVSHEIDYFCVAANPADRLYPNLGFKRFSEEILYPPVGAPAVAYVLDLELAVVEWRKHRPRVLDYFLQPIEGIG